MWMARLWADDASKQDQIDFQTWHDTAPENALAWRQLELLQETFQKVPQSSLSRHALARPKKGLSRRQVLLLGLFTLGNLGLIVTGRSREPNGQEYITAVGEIQTITLSDGSTLAMNTDTRVYVDFDQSARRLHLLKGEILVSSAQHRAPLYVTTSHGKAIPIGTRFTVNQREEETLVKVYEGIVELRPIESLQSLHLNTMQQATFNKSSITQAQELQSNNALWLEHKIQANGSKLTDFISELARHRRGVIRIDPELSKYKVTGTFSTKNTDKTLQNLSEILPITVSYRSSFWVSIKEKI